MNPNEFESSKPPDTYNKIQRLHKYLIDCRAYGLDAAPIGLLLEMVEEIQEKFLKGE